MPILDLKLDAKRQQLLRLRTELELQRRKNRALEESNRRENAQIYASNQQKNNAFFFSNRLNVNLSPLTAPGARSNNTLSRQDILRLSRNLRQTLCVPGALKLQPRRNNFNLKQLEKLRLRLALKRFNQAKKRHLHRKVAREQRELFAQRQAAYYRLSYHA